MKKDYSLPFLHIRHILLFLAVKTQLLVIYSIRIWSIIIAEGSIQDI
ncbi:hypothetical protein [Clostridium sp. UBA6640]|nr:hypothetical protein [Clostridium sp. UBA6640]